MPGIEKAGLSTNLPPPVDRQRREAIQVSGAEKPVRVRLKRIIDPGYFDTVGIPLLAGRGIIDRDRDGTPRVAVINRALAARLAQEAGIKDPVGKVVLFVDGNV